MQKNFLCALMVLALSAARLSAQDFYDIQTVQEIKLTFAQTNWDALLDNLKSTNEEAYLLATSVEINGVLFDSVGVKYKGNSTYNANNQKNPMHIELNTVHQNADYQGYADVKLGNGVADPSFVREALSYEILSNYMECPRANFAKLWINGVYWGLYSNQEGINKKFIKDHLYTDGENPFFKCNPVGGAGPGGSGNPDLVYSSADSAAYYSKYELKSNFGWSQLLTLMSTLKNNPGQIQTILDVDRTLWMHAFNDVLVNLDSYTGAFAQNYYLYMDENGRFVPFVWDLNMSFGGFTNLTSGGGPGGGGSLSIAQMQQMDPLVQSSNTSRPLIQKLLTDPIYKRQYLAHVRTILAENFATTAYRDRALAMQAVIDQAVQDDTKKFYSYQNFLANIDAQVTNSGGGGFGSNVGITQLMNARNTFLNNNANFTAITPAISDIAVSPAVPTPGQTVWITAKITDATAATIGFRNQFWRVFEKTPMYDDGAHQDGAANDGIYGGSFAADAVGNQYYIYAENSSAGRFSPERAEFEFYAINTELPAPAKGDVVINEIMANNQNGSTDEFGQHEDWLEIFNRTGNAYDLAGLQLTDDASDANKFVFPRGSVILPGGYLVIWLDEDGGQGIAHANFKLSSNGEFLMLSDSLGTVYDSLSFGQQTADISFGRYPNGTGAFQSMLPTFAAQNSLASATNEAPQLADFTIFPNPAADYIQVESTQNLGIVTIQNALGQTIMQLDSSNAPTLKFPLAQLTPGIYWVRTQAGAVRSFVHGK